MDGLGTVHVLAYDGLYSVTVSESPDHGSGLGRKALQLRACRTIRSSKTTLFQPDLRTILAKRNSELPLRHKNPQPNNRSETNIVLVVFRQRRKSAPSIISLVFISEVVPKARDSNMCLYSVFLLFPTPVISQSNMGHPPRSQQRGGTSVTSALQAWTRVSKAEDMSKSQNCPARPVDC